MFKGKALLRLVRSSMVVVLFPLLTILLLTNYMISNVDLHKKMLYESSNRNMISLVSHAIAVAANTTHTISQNMQVQGYAAQKHQSYWTERELSTFLSVSITGYQYIEDCLIYLESFDRVLSINGNHDAAFYFTSHPNVNPLGDRTEGQGGYDYFLLASPGELSLYARIYEGSNRQLGYCAIELDIAALTEDLRQLLPSTEDHFALLCGDTVLFSDLPNQRVERFKAQNLLKQSVIILDNRQYYTSHYSLYGETITLLHSQDTTPFFQGLDNDSIWSILLACFLLTMLLCVIVSWLNYRPLKKVFTIARRKCPDAFGKDDSEYRIIELSLATYEQQVERLSQKIQLQNEKFRIFYLEKLLLNQIITYASVGDVMSFFDMSFHRRENFVCIAEVEPVLSATDTYGALDSQDEDEIIADFFEMIREGIETDENLYRLQINHKQIFVCSVHNAVSYQDFIRNAAAKLEQDTLSRIDMSFGSVVDCGEKLSESYEEALKQVDWRDAESIQAPDLASQKDCGDSKSHYSQQCIKIIHSCYTQETLSVESLAEKCGVTVSYLSKIFKREIGMGLLEYLQRYRISCAKKLLNDDVNLRINVICESVGYVNVATFIRVFKKYEGISPGLYRSQRLDRASAGG